MEDKSKNGLNRKLIFDLQKHFKAVYLYNEKNERISLNEYPNATYIELIGNNGYIYPQIKMREDGYLSVNILKKKAKDRVKSKNFAEVVSEKLRNELPNTLRFTSYGLSVERELNEDEVKLIEDELNGYYYKKEYKDEKVVAFLFVPNRHNRNELEKRLKK